MDTRRVGRAVVSKGELQCHMAAEPTQKEQLQIHSSSSSCWKGLRDREPRKSSFWKGLRDRELLKNPGTKTYDGVGSAHAAVIPPRVLNMD